MKHSEKVARWIGSVGRELVAVQFECPECYTTIRSALRVSEGVLQWTCDNGHSGRIS